MPPKAHALLSASSSHRWLNCPPSARLGENYEDKGSDYAAEGTDAHTLCEFRLRQALGLIAEDPRENLTWFNEEMDDCAIGYATYVLELVEAARQACSDPVVLIEQRVDFSRWVESGFGTADCIIIADGILQVCDYKHGRGILVDADENPQMMCYALGALEMFDSLYDIRTVRMTIYQPRRDNISTFELPKEALYQWADEVLKPTADLAFAGNGNFLCGEWCSFCKAKYDCRARADPQVWKNKVDEHYLPYLVDGYPDIRFFNAEDNQRITELGTDINAYVNETYVKFISGDLELSDENIAAYFQTIKDLGYEEYVQYFIDYYDAYKAALE